MFVGSATGRPQHDTQVPAQQHLGASLSQGVKQQRSVLLNFYCDEEGQQHADALYDALQQRHQNIEAVNGCELFGLKQLTSVQLHSGILLACMAAWMERNTHGPHSHLQIVPKVTAFRDHESAYATRIKEHIRFAAKHCEHWVKPSKEEVADFYGRLLLPYVWPEKPIGSWAAADVHLMHLSDQDAEQQWANFANDAAPPQAFVVSTPEACNILPDFFSGILSKKDRSKLQKVYPQTGSEGSWQRATLAALLIHDQDTLASLDSLVTKAEVELLVTLDFNCNKIRVFGRDPGMCIWTQGSPAECSFSIQLLAHAPRQPPGTPLLLAQPMLCCW